MKHIYLAIIVIFFVFNTKAQSVASFDDLTLAPESFFNGSDLSGSFKSGNVIFYNSYNPDWQSWSGFAYSNTTNFTTAGFGNQYSAITGKGYDGSANYAVCYTSPPAEIGFNANTRVSGFYITNSTFAYLSMKNGDSFAKKFGGETGNDPDFFRLMIEALDADGKPVDTIYFYLADFRFTDNLKDYILNKWTWVDLNELKEARKLRFSLSSSDNSFGFMNTPGYFCIDNLNHEILSSVHENKQSIISVFPNPFDDRIIISGIRNNVQITLSDISGRKVAEYNNISDNQVINNLGHLKTGVYLISITEGNNRSISKLIKK